MMNLFLFLSFAFIFTFIVGRWLEKIRVPWIFAALLFGTGLAVYNPFESVTSGSTFKLLAELGMYFLLFMIGLEIDLGEFKKASKFIVKSTLFIILFEALFGTMIVHYLFGYTWIISIVVALSFATVGEAILIPILDEFKMVNTKLGQAIIGIGTLDDVFELITLVLAVGLIGSKTSVGVNFSIIMLSLIVLAVLSFALTKLRKEGKKIKIFKVETLFFLVIALFFLFIGVGEYADSAAIAALIAGVSIKTFIPKERLHKIEDEVRAVCYGLFAPIFFLSVGAEMNLEYLIAYPLLVIIIVAVSKSAKIMGSWIAGHKELGTKKSVLLGIGLSVRFSTSIIIITMLYNAGVVDKGLFSVIVASSIAFKFIVPVLFANLLVKWGAEG